MGTFGLTLATTDEISCSDMPALTSYTPYGANFGEIWVPQR